MGKEINYSDFKIENKLYKLEDLSEEFIYMSDGFFFGRKIQKKDFFTYNMNQKIFFCDETSKKKKKKNLKKIF